jgi:hypothetical protein
MLLRANVAVVRLRLLMACRVQLANHLKQSSVAMATQSRLGPSWPFVIFTVVVIIQITETKTNMSIPPLLMVMATALTV